MAAASPRLVGPGEHAPLGEVPVLAAPEFSDRIAGCVRRGGRIASLSGSPGPGGATRLLAAIALADSGSFGLLACDVRDAYPALTPSCPQAHMFEREIAEMRGVRPEGHPWLKPVRFAGPGSAGAEPGVADFFRVEGDEVHEVAVGPVHAGIIEPGHFRFQCHGEKVMHLEIALGYQHRGAERALALGPDRRSLPIAETIAGDTTIGHAAAHCEVVEALAGCRVPARAEAIRSIALELERMANHVGDLGALAGDVGFLPTAAHCGRIRGDFLNMTALLCGSRFGRGLLCPGGVRFDIDPERAKQLLARLAAAFRDATVAVDLLWEMPSVMARFESTGALSRGTCEELGLVGVAARACGLERDARQEFPSGIYRFFQIPISTLDSGDVFARAWVRWMEVKRSAAFVEERLRALPGGPIRAAVPPLTREAAAVSLVEAWRGEVCHVAATARDGRFAVYKVVDPSFHNWTGLAMALRGQEISDFPLCNKSFNLSYCGHDL